MEKRNIPFNRPDISEAEIEAVGNVLRSGWITTGPETKQLEKELAQYCNVKKAVCLNSATAALELNLRMLGLKEGDEVLVPAYTYTASASPVLHVGATVKFIDSQTDSVEMDYDKMEAAITEKTKAVIPVDLGGVVCDYDRIFKAVENKKHLFKAESPVQELLGRVAVVADCAHSLGASYKGKMTGSIADFSSFSFHAVKNLTTAEGGAAMWNIPGADDDEIYHFYQLFSLHGQSKDAFSKNSAGTWEYDVVGSWYKCNMTDIMAAIGRKQLERYPSFEERRKEIISAFDKVCDEMGVMHLDHYTDDMTSSGHLYITRVPGVTFEQRNEIISLMAQEGIACNVHYKPLPLMSAYKNLGFDIKDFPNARKLYENEITLPLHTLLSDEDVEYIISCYKRIVEKYL